MMSSSSRLGAASASVGGGSSSIASRSSATLITPAVVALSEQSNQIPQVDSHILDYLNIEMLQILQLSSAHAIARQNARRELIEKEFEAELNGADPVSLTSLRRPSLAAAPNLQGFVDSSKLEDEQLRIRLEGMGYRVGWCLAERLAKERAPIMRQPSTLASSTSTSAPIPSLEPLEIVKFVCKDIWISLYDKQIDNLRTNHRGVFVLTDNSFKPLLRLSVANAHDPSACEAGVRKGRTLLGMPCGIVKGALAALGVGGSQVTVEYSGGGSCVFQIKMPQKPQAQSHPPGSVPSPAPIATQ